MRIYAPSESLGIRTLQATDVDDRTILERAWRKVAL